MAVTTDPNAVFYSYRGVGTNQAVKKFIDLLDRKGIPHRGSESEPIEGALTDFEEKIGAANIIVIFYSQDYFESEHCMNEYANIRKYENEARKAATFCVKCGDFKFEDITKKIKNCYAQKWADFKDENKDTLKPINRRTVDNGYYLDTNTTYCIQKLDNYFSKTARYKEDSLQTLVGLICDKYRELSSKNTSVNQSVTINSAPSFKLPTQSDLVPRDYFVEKLHTLISNNTFSNLYGFGGSGKTSLIYLFLKNLSYRSEYNQIAYVVVNKNIKTDFVSQINDTIHLFKPEDDEIKSFDDMQVLTEDDENEEESTDRYKSVIKYLETNYKSEKPNLLIIDINNAEGATEFGEDLTDNNLVSNKIYPDGWKYLIVSRGKIFKEPKKVLNLNNEETGNENTVFLKELFLTCWRN